MSDVTQGQDAASDQELFRDAVDDNLTLEKFENPTLPPEPKEAAKAPPSPASPDQPEGPVPSGRFREETEARRRAEQENTELRAQLAAFQVAQGRQQQPQAQPVDMFDNPAAYIQQIVGPALSAMEARNQQKLENLSADNAVRFYGHDVVSNSRNALQVAMNGNDPVAWATYNRAMQSHDPYGVITRWHLDNDTLSRIGGDLNAYNKKVLDQAMTDPNFQRQVLAAMRGNAQSPSVNRPIPQQVSPQFPPSLSEMGTVGPDEGSSFDNSGEMAMFRAAVSAKRR